MMELESEGLVWCVISSCCVCVCDAAVFLFLFWHLSTGIFGTRICLCYFFSYNCSAQWNIARDI